MRVFLAIEFPEDIKEYLDQIHLVLREQSKTGNFTKKDNYHLTLRFIGEIKDHELDKLKEVIDEIALKHNCFQLTMNKVGCFARGSKMIIWVGINQNETLGRLYSQLEQSLERKGYTKEERNFVPHVTIARQVVLMEDLKKMQQQIKMDNIIIPVSKLSLMESTRVKGELRYIPLYTKNLSPPLMQN
ncbi:MAG: hypothetical protein APF76_01970 [Desulfitibacter sp. BRH_c19]|nr:MAG: hypothetical protein APF76_01970 [Desulfitibacter sp. BRH_c19]